MHAAKLCADDGRVVRILLGVEFHIIVRYTRAGIFNGGRDNGRQAVTAWRSDSHFVCGDGTTRFYYPISRTRTRFCTGARCGWHVHFTGGFMGSHRHGAGQERPLLSNGSCSFHAK